MIKIVFTKHALERLKERGISEKEVREFIKNPDKIERSLKSPNRFLIKKIYFNRKLKKRSPSFNYFRKRKFNLKSYHNYRYIKN
jgi:hypothetical protein